MKKLKIFGLLVTAMVLAMGLAFVGCGSDDDDSGSGEKYEPRTYEGTTAAGEEVKIVVSTDRRVSRVLLTPQTGDSYEIFVNGVSTSKGKITVNGMYVTFTPDGGGSPFTGSLDGNDWIIPSIPGATGAFIPSGKPPIVGGTPTNPVLPSTSTDMAYAIAETQLCSSSDGRVVISTVVYSPVYTGTMQYLLSDMPPYYISGGNYYSTPTDWSIGVAWTSGIPPIEFTFPNKYGSKGQTTPTNLYLYARAGSGLPIIGGVQVLSPGW